MLTHRVPPPNAEKCSSSSQQATALAQIQYLASGSTTYQLVFKMAKLSLSAFIRLRTVPQVTLIEAYLIAKVSFVLFELLTTFLRQKVASAHPNYSICCLVAYCSGMVCGCGCCCLCCCNCCRRKPGTWSTALSYYINLVTRINCYFVKLLLGPAAIVTRKSAMYKKTWINMECPSSTYAIRP